jgi:hypothetical protein
MQTIARDPGDEYVFDAVCTVRFEWKPTLYRHPTAEHDP